MHHVLLFVRILKWLNRSIKSYKDIPKTKLVLDGDFEFTPGIDITEVSQVKGLEFDYVILPDVNFSNYSESNEDRRTLHVAATRAVHQLWVISLANPSKLLEEFINLNPTAVNCFDSFFLFKAEISNDFYGLYIADATMECFVHAHFTLYGFDMKRNLILGLLSFLVVQLMQLI